MTTGARMICVLLSLGTGGCTDLGDDRPDLNRPPEFTATFESISIEDAEILRISYSTYFAPVDFYREDLAGGHPYYESTLSIAPLTRRRPPFFELSTDDPAEALAWSESSSVNSAYYRELRETTETERYFQFRRVRSLHPQDILLSRIHKRSYFDRSMWEMGSPGPLIGRLNARPIDGPAVRNLAEYLWFLGNHNVAMSRAIASVPAATSDTLSCALYHLEGVGGDWGIRDVFMLKRTVFAVARATGDVLMRTETVRTVEGRLNAGLGVDRP